MDLPFFKTSLIKIYRLIEEENQEDPYSNPKRRLELVDEVMGDVQPLSPREGVDEYGDYSTNTYQIFLPIGANVQYDDRLEAEGYPFYMRVRGEPEKRKILGYIRVICDKQEIGQWTSE